MEYSMEQYMNKFVLYRKCNIVYMTKYNPETNETRMHHISTDSGYPHNFGRWSIYTNEGSDYEILDNDKIITDNIERCIEILYKYLIEKGVIC